MFCRFKGKGDWGKLINSRKTITIQEFEIYKVARSDCSVDYENKLN